MSPLTVELKHVFSSGNVIEYQVFKDGEFVGQATYYPPFKELRISVGRSEAVAINGELKRELSYIHEEDEPVIREVIKLIFSRHSTSS